MGKAHIVYMCDGERRQWRGGSGFVVRHGGEGEGEVEISCRLTGRRVAGSFIA